MDSDGLSKIALRIKHRQSPRYKILEETSTPQLEKELSRIKFPVALRPVRYYGDKAFQKGFTLIELLVVVAIIGLLSSVVLASLSTARAKARDARRIADLEQLQTAMELYYSDHGHYPCESSSACAEQNIGANGKIGEGSGLDTLLAPYISFIPHDPLGPGNSSYYYYYDGRQLCSGRPNIAVVFARQMEEQSGNGPTFCSSWGGEGGAGNPETYHVVLGDSDG